MRVFGPTLLLSTVCVCFLILLRVWHVRQRWVRCITIMLFHFTCHLRSFSIVVLLKSVWLVINQWMLFRYICSLMALLGYSSRGGRALYHHLHPWKAPYQEKLWSIRYWQNEWTVSEVSSSIHNLYILWSSLQPITVMIRWGRKGLYSTRKW